MKPTYHEITGWLYSSKDVEWQWVTLSWWQWLGLSFRWRRRPSVQSTHCYTAGADPHGYRTTQDIRIPAGTQLEQAPDTIRHHVPHLEVLVPLADDATGVLILPRDDARRAGVLDE